MFCVVESSSVQLSKSKKMTNRIPVGFDDLSIADIRRVFTALSMSTGIHDAHALVAHVCGDGCVVVPPKREIPKKEVALSGVVDIAEITVKKGIMPPVQRFIETSGLTVSATAIKLVASAHTALREYLSYRKSDPQKLTFVRVTFADLSLSEKEVSLGHVFLAAKKQGLSLCPSWLGPVLREVYFHQQPEGERLLVAAEPLIVDDEPLLFFLGYTKGEECWLSTYSGSSKKIVSSKITFCFMKQ